MYNYFPLLFVGGVVGLFSIIFTIAYMTIKNKKEDIGIDNTIIIGVIALLLMIIFI